MRSGQNHSVRPKFAYAAAAARYRKAKNRQNSQHRCPILPVRSTPAAWQKQTEIRQQNMEKEHKNGRNNSQQRPAESLGKSQDQKACSGQKLPKSSRNGGGERGRRTREGSRKERESRNKGRRVGRRGGEREESGREAERQREREKRDRETKRQRDKHHLHCKTTSRVSRRYCHTHQKCVQRDIRMM